MGCEEQRARHNIGYKLRYKIGYTIGCKAYVVRWDLAKRVSRGV
jgi:hypothetical protein